jgi:hypothetical protein
VGRNGPVLDHQRYLAVLRHRHVVPVDAPDQHRLAVDDDPLDVEDPIA